MKRALKIACLAATIGASAPAFACTLDPHGGLYQGGSRGQAAPGYYHGDDYVTPGAYRVPGGTVIPGAAQSPGCGGGPGQYPCPNPVYIPDRK